MASWQYDRPTRRYRDAKTGKFLSEAHVTQARDAFLLDQQQQYREHTAKLASGDLSVQEWLRTMRQNLKTSFGAEYMLGRGGRQAMTQRDWGRVGNLCKAQYGYLQRFAEEVSAGRLSDAQAQARSALYASSAVRAHSSGQVAAWDVGSLPQQPGDGNTACMSNCRCSLDWSETDTEVRVTWRVQGDAESCDDCLALGDDWNPYTVAKDQEEAA